MKKGWLKNAIVRRKIRLTDGEISLFNIFQTPITSYVSEKVAFYFLQKKYEEMMFNSILIWTQYDPDRRRKDFPILFSKLNFNFLSLDFMRSVVAKEVCDHLKT